MQPFHHPCTPIDVTNSAALKPSPSDEVLAREISHNGDEHAFRVLYRRYTPGLYQFALRLLGGNEFDAEDVLQETWITAVKKLPEFRWEASLKTWLTSIALNLCRSTLRRKDRRWLQVDEDVSKARATHESERIDLETALSQLAAGYRAVLVLHDVHGYTHEQIGQALSISANTSKSQLSRARKNLRTMLAPYELEPKRIGP
ncbi:MAG: sigma-70 family RNA polymerase sigma factor [Gemmatimonadota bacterium]|nr:sigma-70 family RNA polymerase sigma factor [Gemmatimonadota bacterium]